MDQKIHSLFNDQILAAAAEFAGQTPASLQALDGFESFIYEYEIDGQGRILRVTHSSHRSADMIRGEVEWVNYLSKWGVSCAQALPATNEKLVNTVADAEDGYFSVVSFARAPGRPPEAADLTAQLFTAWGREIGRMHRLTKNYVPSDPAFKRPEWYEDNYNAKVDQYLPADQSAVAQKINEHITLLRSWETTNDSYGLIHTDAHWGNFFVDDGRITFFDFDDSSYKWFVSDIAIFIFYLLSQTPANQTREEFAGRILRPFMNGYRAENRLDPVWMERLPLFLKMREMSLYVAIYAAVGEKWRESPYERYMLGKEEAILNDVPVLNMSFTSF